jgi:uncharacterized phage-associated protein
MADIAARHAADYLIAFSREVGDPLTNLKLQKLLFYAQGWFLALQDRPLFNERIEAWPHGPVVPPIYGTFKKWGWSPIGEDIAVPEFSKEVKAHLDEVMKVFGGFTAYTLEQMTHNEKPWIDARGSLLPDEPSTSVISHESMKAHFKQIATST